MPKIIIKSILKQRTLSDEHYTWLREHTNEELPILSINWPPPVAEYDADIPWCIGVYRCTAGPDEADEATCDMYEAVTIFPDYMKITYTLKA